MTLTSASPFNDAAGARQNQSVTTHALSSRIMRAATTTALALALLGMTACAPEPAPEPAAAEAPTAESSAVEPVVAEELKTGDALDAATAEKLKEEFRNAAKNDAVYTTTTGEHLLVRAG